MKAKSFISLILLLIVILILPSEAVSQRRRKALRTATADSLRKDSLQADTVRKKKQPLDAPVTYSANDSIVYEAGGDAHLYGNGKVKYQKIGLGAEIITMNMDSSVVHAHGVKDTAGVEKGKPVFKDGDTEYNMEVVNYNFKSKRGFLNKVVTQQGEGYVTGNSAKKSADDILFMQNGQYTTCDHHDHPHFYLQLTRAKVHPKKNVVTGPAYLVIEDVPLKMIGVPFFFFPFSSSYSSGFIMPTYMDDSSRGFGLTRGGYYFALSDYMDLKATGDIFTKGSWRLGLESSYNKRYKYSGSLLADYQVTKTGDKNMPDYLVSKDFKLVWSHRQDPKASPNQTFSASVNFTTSSYERSNLNNLYNSQLLTQSTKTSSVSYSRTFPDAGITLSATANVAQVLRDSSISVTLPDLNISRSRFYPFKRKKAVGDEKWYEKISLQYTGRLTNSIKTKDNMLFKSSLIKDWSNAMEHTIPVSATFTLLKYFNVTPSFNYTERWYSRKFNREYSDVQRTWLPTDTVYGFHRVANYNVSLGVSTKLYGMYKPLLFKKREIQIRHVFTPTVSISGAPAFKQYWQEHVDANGVTQYYSPYQDQLFGTAPRERSGVVTFDVSNNLEAKYKNKKDSVKKISLIDELGGTLSYNLAAATKPWSDLSMRLRLKLPGNYTFSMNATFATYAYTFDKNGNVTIGDRTEWSYGRFGRFSGWGSSFSYTLDNEKLKKLFGHGKNKDDNGEKKANANSKEEDTEENTNNSPEKKVVQAKADANGYQEFKMPWSLNLNYSFNISEDQSKPINRNNMRYPYRYTHNLNMSGNIKLSNKWNVTFNSGYDFQAKKITQTALTVSRDLHCFSMSASLSPFGVWKYYSFRISANASILQDLKWDQRSQTQSNVQWY